MRCARCGRPTEPRRGARLCTAPLLTPTLDSVTSRHLSPWWDEFVTALVAPAAAAEMVLTFVGAAIAFLGALWLFRRQLSHDRALAQGQLLADRTERLYEARRLAARQLGMGLIEAKDEFERTAPYDLAAALRVKGFRGAFNAPGAHTMKHAADLASYELDLDDSVLDLWRARLAWWDNTRIFVNFPAILELDDADQGEVLFALVDEFFATNNAQLQELGVALVRWDGVGEVPTLDEVQVGDLELQHHVPKVMVAVLKRELDRIRARDNQ